MGTVKSGFWNLVGAGLQPILRFADKTKITGKINPRKAVLPKPHTPIAASSTAEVDSILQKLDEQKQHWLLADTNKRNQLLTACLKNIMAIAKDMATVGTAAKGSYEGGIGDEMGTILPVVSALLEYKESMLAKGQRKPLKLYRRPDGQWVAVVWPVNMVGAFFPNFVGELWIEPGAEPSQGELYKHKDTGQPGPGQVALVLGAGNQLPVVALDILHMLFSEDKVVLCKMNPVNDYYGPLLKQAFSPLVTQGVLGFVYGGADVGAYCCEHPLVGAVHLTGSERTYNNIMFGSPEPSGAPHLHKRVTAELGNVTPYIIVPGPWSAADIEYHATSVASGLAQNAGHNCVAAEIVITDPSWPQRGAFMDALARCLDNLQQRAPWYPGSAARLAAFKQRFPTAQALGQPVSEQGQPDGLVSAQPWLLVTGLAPDEAQTRHENWGGVLQEVVLPGCHDTADFIRQAVNFANNKCWGTLSVSMFIHPATQQQYADVFDSALAALRYGNITINCPSFVGFSATPLVWGAFPGNTPQNIGSGVGFVHNTYMYDRPQKSVLRAPWTYSPQPLWSVGQIGLAAALPPAFKFLANQHNPLLALVYLIVVAVHALRGSWAVAAKWNKKQYSAPVSSA